MEQFKEHFPEEVKKIKEKIQTHKIVEREKLTKA